MTNWERLCRGLTEVLSRHLLGRPEEKQRHETKIQTGNFPNTNRIGGKVSPLREPLPSHYCYKRAEYEIVLGVPDVDIVI